MNNNFNYICISEIDRYTSVYDIHKNDTVIMNDIEVPSISLKIGDIVTFNYNNKQVTIKVNCIWTEYFRPSCVNGQCIIQMPNGKYKRIDELDIGDLVITGNLSFAKVKCILKTIINCEDDIYYLNNLEITGYHPVYFNGKWDFPCNLSQFKKKTKYIDSLYSIGLENNESMIINNIVIIGLGHNIQNNLIASHDYLGTDKVINDIFKIAPDGYCIIKPNQIIRNKITGLIEEIKYI